jgi:hypothetical protein
MKACLVYLFLAALPLLAMEDDACISVESYQQERIVALLPLLNTWADREFSHYPYLLSSPKDQIVCPSDLVFVNSSDALITLAESQGHIVGMAAMISFDSPVLHAMYFDRFRLFEKMQALGIDCTQMLYVAYFLTAPDCHNDPKVVKALYDRIVAFAQEKGKTQLCYMEDIGDPDHPYRIEPWGDVIDGCKSLKLQVRIAWPTQTLDGPAQDLQHTLEFFAKNLY